MTEETTEVDLVRAQILIAGGATLGELGLAQDEIRQRGVALQCRVTTENPGKGFRPDAGRITAYRSPGGAGIRLDEGSAFVGAEVSPYFDPLLVKVTARGSELGERGGAGAPRGRRAARARRLDEPELPRWRCCATRRSSPARRTPAFVDEHPDLIAADPGADRASRLLARLADVDGEPGARPAGRRWPTRARSCPPIAGRAAPGLAPAPARARARPPSRRRCARSRRSR